MRIDYDENGNPIQIQDPYPTRPSQAAPAPEPMPYGGDPFTENIPQGPAPTGPYPGYSPYGGPMKPDLSFWENAPGFDFSYQPFVAPTLAQAEQEPGYEFSRRQGEQALRQNEASLGRLRGGGTLKALADYNRNAATQNYSGVYDRNLRTYGTNWNNAFQTAKAAFEPRLQGWQTKMGIYGDAAKSAFQRAWDAYQFGQNQAYDQWKTQYEAGIPKL